MMSGVQQANTSERRQAPDLLPSVKRLGWTLGLAAALIAVRSPVFGSVISPSMVLVAMALTQVFVGNSAIASRWRPTGIDLMVASYGMVRIVIEVSDSITLRGQVSLGACLDWLVLVAAWCSVRALVSSRDEALVFLDRFARPGTFVAVLALVQLAAGASFNRLITDWTNSGGLTARLDRGADLRATSTIGHWTALGGYLCVVAGVVSLLLVLKYQQTGRRDATLLARIAFLSLGQIATLTFASVALHFVIVMLALWLVRIRLRFLGACLVLAIGASVVFGSLISARIDHQTSSSQFYGDPLPFLPESISFRIGVWTQESIPTVESRPFLGFGMSAYDRLDETGFAPLLQWTSPESEYFRTLVSAGLVGLLFQLALFFTFGRILRHSSQVIGKAGRIPMVTFIGILLISAIHAHFTNRGVPLPLYCLIGALLPLTTGIGPAPEAPLESHFPRTERGRGREHVSRRALS